MTSNFTNPNAISRAIAISAAVIGSSDNCVLFTDSSGLLEEDPGYFSYIKSTHHFGLGTSTPAYAFDMDGGTLNLSPSSQFAIGGDSVLSGGSGNLYFGGVSWTDLYIANAGWTALWPTSDGSSGDSITTDGAGNLYFSSGGGGGSITLTNDVTGSGTGTIATTISAIQGNPVLGTTGFDNVVFSTNPVFPGSIAVGDILDNSALNAINLAGVRQFYDPTGANVLLDLGANKWFDSSPTLFADANTRQLFDSNPSISVDANAYALMVSGVIWYSWGAGQGFDGSGAISFDQNNRYLYTSTFFGNNVLLDFQYGYANDPNGTRSTDLGAHAACDENGDQKINYYNAYDTLYTNCHSIYTQTSTSTTGLPNANAGTGATCTISGNDVCGIITLNTGSTGLGSGLYCSVHFGEPYYAGSTVVSDFWAFDQFNASAAMQTNQFFSQTTNTDAYIGFNLPLNPLTTYQWNYSINAYN